MIRQLLLASSVLLVSCVPPVEGPAPRAAGVRVPLSASCGALDDTRCMLPWPSNEYAVTDETSATGLRLSMTWRSLPVLDSPASLNKSDGFSVATPIAVGFPRPLAGTLQGKRRSTELQLILAQPERANRGEPVPLRLSVVNDELGSASLLVGYPERPLEFDTDYVAFALDSTLDEGGATYEQPALVKIALGLVAPSNEAERALAAYHAPTRALLVEQGVSLEHVIRVWDFTTRSAGNVTAPLEKLRTASLAAVTAGGLTVLIDSAAVVRRQSRDRSAWSRDGLAELRRFCGRVVG